MLKPVNTFFPPRGPFSGYPAAAEVASRHAINRRREDHSAIEASLNTSSASLIFESKEYFVISTARRFGKCSKAMARHGQRVPVLSLT
jgi:hypothetical protein